MPPELLEDLQDLREAIATVEAAIALDDPEAIALAQRDVLALIESLAVLHCDIREKFQRDRQQTLRRVGVREIPITLGHQGWWYVAKPETPCN